VITPSKGAVTTHSDRCALARASRATASSTAAVWNADRNEVTPLSAFTRIMEAKGAKFALTDLPIISTTEENPPLELVTTYPLDPPLRRIILLSQRNRLDKAYDWGTITTDKIYLYRFRNLLPSAKVFHQAVFVKDDQEALDLLADGGFPLDEKVIVSGLSQDTNLGLPAGKESVEIVKNTDEEKVYRVTTSSPSILSTTDYTYPGWKVFVDGRQEVLLTTNYNFRGVYLEQEGQREVRFLFQPLSFRLGLIISLLTLGTFLILGKKTFFEPRNCKKEQNYGY